MKPLLLIRMIKITDTLLVDLVLFLYRNIFSLPSLIVLIPHNIKHLLCDRSNNTLYMT